MSPISSTRSASCITASPVPSAPWAGREASASPRKRQTSTGSALPLTVNGGRGSNAKAWAVSCRAVPLTRTCPSSEAERSRAAVFTVSPVTAYAASLAAPSRPATTGPVLIPRWSLTGPPNQISQRALTSWPRSSIRRAALSARSGSSSWATGAPNTAMTASPTNFSTKPP